MILKTIFGVLGLSPKYWSFATRVTVLLASSYLSSLYGPMPTGAMEYAGYLKPSPWATTLFASPALSAVGDCIENESSDRIVGKLEVARVMSMTAVEASLAVHDLYSEVSGLSLKPPKK